LSGPGQNPLGRRSLIYDAQQLNIRHAVDAYDARSTDVLEGKMPSGLEKVRAPVLDVSNALESRYPAVRFLDHVVAVRRVQDEPAQPLSNSALVGQYMASDPSEDFFAGLRHPSTPKKLPLISTMHEGRVSVYLDS
jgi:hypothetical protein